MKFNDIVLTLCLLSALGCQNSGTTSKTSTSEEQSETTPTTSTTRTSDNYPMSDNTSESTEETASDSSYSVNPNILGTIELALPERKYSAISTNWQMLYKNSKLTSAEFECNSPTGSGFDIRRGTITIAGDDTWYIPGGDTTYLSRTGKFISAGYSLKSFTKNTSSFLATAEDAKKFFDTKNKLKVRFKIRPQPIPTKNEIWCYNRLLTTKEDTWGYSNLKFNVSLVGLNSDGSLKKSGNYPVFEATKLLRANPKTCSEAIDFSEEIKKQPYGAVIVIHDVATDSSCLFGSCLSYKPLSRSSCWQMDIEASVDGTKDI
jgi:hypothetical protein